MDELSTIAGPDQLRKLVREALADVLRSAPPRAAPPGAPSATRPAAEPARLVTQPAIAASPPDSVPAGDTLGRPATPGSATPGSATPRQASANPADPGSWTVRIGGDDELHAFVLRVLRLADNPKLRRDLISGRVRFSLAGPSAAQAAQAVLRIDKGAVTERTVIAAANAGSRLVLGPRAVLTPLARDKARAAGVPIDKER